jgi:hypothetical protein
MKTINNKHGTEKVGTRSRRGRFAAGCVTLLISLLAVVVPAAPANAASRCPAFVTWQDWIGGARVHAYVDFRPSDTCNGRHVKKAYVRLIRRCGPSYDTGRLYTYTASSPTDTRLFSMSAWIFDSVLWGCRTDTLYGYEYF